MDTNPKPRHAVLSLLAVQVGVLCLVGCGGGAHDGGNGAQTSSRSAGTSASRTSSANLGGGGGGAATLVIARVGASTITRGELSRWMDTFAAGDFYEVSHGHIVPAGLVSDPPDYRRCASSLRAAAKQKASRAELASKCRLLYQNVRLQALKWLVETHWRIALYAALGITASRGQVRRLYDQQKAEEFPTEARRRAYLAARGLSLAGYLYITKLNVLGQKSLQALKTAGHGVLAALKGAEGRTTAETSCRSGYVVEHCKQFTGPASAYSVSPAVLLEQVAALTGSRCINLQACGATSRQHG